MGTFFSHPDRKLEDHLRETLEHARALLADATMLSPGGTISVGSTPLHDMLNIIVTCHDLGKATSFFQSKIAAARAGIPYKGGFDAVHAPVSALLALSVVYHYLGCSVRSPDEAISCVAVFEIIDHHHGAFGVNVSRGFKHLPNTFKKREYLIKQVRDLRSGAYCYLENLYGMYLSHLAPLRSVTFEDIFTFAEQLAHFLVLGNDVPIVKKFIHSVSWHAGSLDTLPPANERERDERFGWFFGIKLLCSILLESDKMNAAFGDQALAMWERPNPSPVVTMRGTVSKYKQGKFAGKVSRMNDQREKISKEVAKTVPSLGNDSPSGKIFSLNAPTGSGKTLVSLELAGDIAAALGCPNAPRLIYNLPFLSITDQVTGVLDSLLNLGQDGASSGTLIVHHHLAPVSYKVRDTTHRAEGDDEGTSDYRGSAAELLIGSWNAAIIVSTFHQLTAALFSTRNKDALKFNKVCGSILILDEVQCLPVRYWQLIRETFSRLSKLVGVPVLVMSATMPAIFPACQVNPVLSNPARDYFGQLDRIAITVCTANPTTVDSLAAGVHAGLQPGKSYLVVVNTRECARNLHDALIGLRDAAGKNYKIWFMSSDVLPSERRNTIDTLKYIQETGSMLDIPVVLVSTQVVEAGVDLDFDRVYRDIAPLDSIIQVAGRCNRNDDPAKRGMYTIVHLFQTDADDDLTMADYAKMVYDPFMISCTEKILSRGVTGEKDWYPLAERYYSEISDYMTGDVSKRLVESIEMLDFANLNDCFSLIEQETTINVFLSEDLVSEKIWTAFTSLAYEKDRLKRKDLFLELRAEFEARIVSVRLNHASAKTLERCSESGSILRYSDDLCYVSPANFQTFYDEKGFHLPKL